MPEDEIVPLQTAVNNGGYHYTPPTPQEEANSSAANIAIWGTILGIVLLLFGLIAAIGGFASFFGNHYDEKPIEMMSLSAGLTGVLMFCIGGAVISVTGGLSHLLKTQCRIETLLRQQVEDEKK